jgi:hypothetical protein
VRSLVAGLIAFAIAIQPGVAAAFGSRGHQIVGAIADQLLSANARLHVHRALGTSLQVAAPWADCVKNVAAQPGGGLQYQPDDRYRAGCSSFDTAAGRERMIGYARRNWSNCGASSRAFGAPPCHASYHFADIAVQRDKYDRSFVGANDHDVVSALDAAIAVLRGSRAPAPFVIDDKTEALRVVAHLVGDVHQPLHVGAVYLDDAGSRIDPDHLGSRSGAQASTRGGNRLEDGEANLHAEWDEVPKNLKPSKLRVSMLKAARAVAVTPGKVEAWPKVWASQTVGAAAEALRGISFSQKGARLDSDWVVEFEDRESYLTMKDELQLRQLTLAGARLAQVLNAVWP